MKGMTWDTNIINKHGKAKYKQNFGLIKNSQVWFITDRNRLAIIFLCNSQLMFLFSYCIENIDKKSVINLYPPKPCGISSLLHGSWRKKPDCFGKDIMQSFACSVDLIPLVSLLWQILCDWQKVAGWKYTIMGSGGWSVMMSGPTWMPVWYANNWGTGKEHVIGLSHLCFSQEKLTCLKIEKLYIY